MIESAYEAFWGSESVDPKRLVRIRSAGVQAGYKDVSWLFHADN